MSEDSAVYQLKTEVAAGDAFKVWASSDVGRYIIARAKQYEIDVLRELGDADPSDMVQIVKLQAEARAPKLLLSWVGQCIAQGEEARFALMEADE